jgi:hypothetical protein
LSCVSTVVMCSTINCSVSTGSCFWSSIVQTKILSSTGRIGFWIVRAEVAGVVMIVSFGFLILSLGDDVILDWRLTPKN